MLKMLIALLILSNLLSAILLIKLHQQIRRFHYRWEMLTDN
jgi:hypothetical protein